MLLLLLFQLSIIKDTLSVHPAQFGVPPDEALITEINKKYANRVLHDLGLCVCLFDLVQAGEGKDLAQLSPTLTFP